MTETDSNSNMSNDSRIPEPEPLRRSDPDLRSDVEIDNIEVVIPPNRGIFNYIHNLLITRLRERRLGLILTENIYERLSRDNEDYAVYSSIIKDIIDYVIEYFNHKRDCYLEGEYGRSEDAHKNYLLHWDLIIVSIWYESYLLGSISQVRFVSIINEILPRISSGS
jgi:hypothetical protein